MKSPVEVTRIYALALVLAVVIPSLLVGIYFGIDRTDWSAVIPAFFFATIYASFHVLVLAFPTFLAFQHLGLVNLQTSVTAGFVIGCIPTSFLVGNLAAGLLVGMVGAIGGGAFWLVVRRTIEDTLTEPPTGPSTMKSRMQTVCTYAFAFLSAAMVPTFILGLFSGFTGRSPSSIFFLYFGAIYASFHVLVLALPTFLVFQRLGLVNLRTSVMAGFVIGCIPSALFTIVVWTNGFNADFLTFVPLMGACGALGGWVFWLVIRRTKEQVLTKPQADLEP